MEKLRFVGLDVHKDTITVAVADEDGRAPEVLATIPNEVGGERHSETNSAHSGRNAVRVN